MTAIEELELSIVEEYAARNIEAHYEVKHKSTGHRFLYSAFHLADLLPMLEAHSGISVNEQLLRLREDGIVDARGFLMRQI